LFLNAKIAKILFICLINIFSVKEMLKHFQLIGLFMKKSKVKTKKICKLCSGPSKFGICIEGGTLKIQNFRILSLLFSSLAPDLFYNGVCWTKLLFNSPFWIGICMQGTLRNQNVSILSRYVIVFWKIQSCQRKVRTYLLNKTEKSEALVGRV
jgi:hypothetical protein